jgi:multimeric flavodoxin WrbA
MKIVAINGSPKGKDGNTNLMVSAFLKGAQEAGAQIINIFLAEKEINHCKGCFSCWFITPGQCVIQDDMTEVLSQGERADILILATPIKYANLSSVLKVFIERMLVLCNPYFKKDPKTGMIRHPKKTEAAETEGMSFYRAKLVMIASGGLSTRDHFQVISHWVKKLAFYNHTEVIGEIYAPQGLLLNTQEAELRPVIDNYLQLLNKAGKEIVTKKRLSEETGKLLEQNFIPDDIYIEQVNSFFDSMLSKLEHPYLKG